VVVRLCRSSYGHKINVSHVAEVLSMAGWLRDFFHEAFGVTGQLGLPAFTMLMIIAVVAIIISILAKRAWLALSLGVFALVLLVLVPVISYYFPQPPYPLPIPQDKPPSAPAPVQNARWFDTGMQVDWVARDRYYGATEFPAYEIDGVVLCSDNHLGRVATCWSSRRADPSSMAPGVPTNITQRRNDWCAYKDSSITLTTKGDGAAAPGRVYACARSIER
jgi:hypothetical protein